MSKKLYVYSTLASDMNYTNHAAGGGDMPIDLPPVFIKGGAGVANDRLITPRGVATEITEEDLAYLRQNEVFKLHEANGFVLVSDLYDDPDKVAADMAGRDPSAPVVPQDLGDDNQPTGSGDATATSAATAAAKPATSKPKKSGK